MSESFGVALLGCGTVGTGVAELLQQQQERLTQRAGKQLVLRHVVVKDPSKQRSSDLPSQIITTDLQLVLRDPQVDVVVELVGGTTSAREAVLAALDARKHVVTANKALLAHHGSEVFRKAHENNRTIAFEASVAGGIPIIGAITQGLAANEIESVQGILNGTCNFILSSMTEQGLDYSAALTEAQRLGYAEADPTLDIDGSDSAHKLAILARLAFDTEVNLGRIERRGIDSLTPLDIRLAGELGYVFKLIAEARHFGGYLSLQVTPTLVRRGTPLADVSGANNAIQIHGDAVGEVFLAGPGAGQMPTASAVVSDIIDLAIGRAQLTFNTLRLWEQGSSCQWLTPDEMASRFYLRLTLTDQPGVLAEIAALLAAQDISVASVIQHEMPDDGANASATVVIMTHAAPAGKLQAALQAINESRHSCEPGVAYRVT